MINSYKTTANHHCLIPLQILQSKPSGLWVKGLSDKYGEMFGEAPPADLISRLPNWPDIVEIEQAQNGQGKILYPCESAPPSIRLTQSASASTIHIPPVQLPQIGSKLSVYVSFVENPSCFYVQAADSSVEDLNATLQETYESRCAPRQLSGDPQPGTYCVAKYEGSTWYRACIVSVEPSGTGGSNSDQQITVYYVDYGNRETMTQRRVRQILDPFAKQLSAQAIKCRMIDVHPPDCIKWTPADVSKFQKCYDFNRMLTIQVVDVQHDCCDVMLLDSEKPEVCINRMLVERGIARSTRLTSEPPALTLSEPGVDMEVFVCYVESVCDVTVRRVGPEYSQRLDALQEKLADLESVSYDTVRPIPNNVMAVKICEDDTWSWFRFDLCFINFPVLHHVLIHYLYSSFNIASVLHLSIMLSDQHYL